MVWLNFHHTGEKVVVLENIVVQVKQQVYHNLQEVS